MAQTHLVRRNPWCSGQPRTIWRSLGSHR